MRNPKYMMILFFFLLSNVVLAQTTTGSAEEYRGYNGRTLEQAYYRCKYEAFRAAPPGERSKAFFEKMRIRMYVMDSCMNSEGFFRTRSTFGGFDKDLITFADVF
ncbi:MAG: hypothetical protein ACOYOK_06110 [Pseudobdellovibrionaceae bacterium]